MSETPKFEEAWPESVTHLREAMTRPFDKEILMGPLTTAPLLTTRDALVRELERHIGAHASIVANDLLASGILRDPSTLADDRRLVERVAADQKEAADSWGAPLPGAELSMRARLALRSLAAALTEDPS